MINIEKGGRQDGDVHHHKVHDSLYSIISKRDKIAIRDVHHHMDHDSLV